MKTKANAKPEKAITVRFPAALNSKLVRTAKKTGMKRSEVLRLAVDRGMDRLLEQLTGQPPA